VIGICGIVYNDKESSLKQGDLLPMVRAGHVSGTGQPLLVCSGPVGFAANGGSGGIRGLAMMESQKGHFRLAVHGNIYNAKDLIDPEEQNGNLSDLLLRLYRKEGMGIINRLRGEFALAVWDGPREVVYLATDRFRVQPLFYYADREKLLFASQLKSLLASTYYATRTIDCESILDLVASSMIPTPKTIFRETKKLPPGYILSYQKGEIELSPYWDITFLRPAELSKGELVCELKASVNEAINLRLQADGVSDRIGTFLSGGVDSTTVTGVLTQIAKCPIKSFSIGFEEDKFNEINYARIAARALGTQHHEYFVTSRDVADAIPNLIEAFDEPFANASAIPTYFCAKLAREHGVAILYAGDGGDELFAGNERYASQRLFERYAKIPSWLRASVMNPMVLALADRVAWEIFIKARKYVQRAGIPYPERLTSYGFFNVVPLSEFFTEDLLQAAGHYNPYAPVHHYYRVAPADQELDRQLYIDLKLAISDNDLIKVTRMTQAAGVSARFPLLDHKLAEFAATIPAKIKMPGMELRSFFKKAYSDLLPPEIQKKQKHGFGLPIAVWLRNDKALNEQMHDLVLSPRSVQRGYFRKRALEAVVDSHQHDESSFYGTIVWNLMVLELWHRKWLDPDASVNIPADHVEPLVAYR
jgi:asparagine synthase (glutamine-hydrolysing)